MQTYFPNFELREFLESDTAKARGIDNTPSFSDVLHIMELCEVLLQPLRDAWGSPINVTSGYRCEKLNKAVGGVSSSAHLIGYAVDLQPGNGRFEDFVKFVRAWVAKYQIKFDQILIESQGCVKWLHIGLRSNGGLQRRQIKFIDL